MHQVNFKTIRSSLISKRGAVAIAIAEDLLHVSMGERIRTIRDYASSLDVSVGTIETAFDSIESMRAVKLESKGRSGTFVSYVSYPILWLIARGRPIVGGMPLPWSRRIQGLATGIRVHCSQEPCDLDLRYLRGSINRLSALASKSLDWALVSRFVSETAHVHGFRVNPTVLFGASTYISRNVILFSDSKFDTITDGMQVGIDRESTDHTYKVHSICRGKRVQYVDIKYSQGLDLISSGAIDATIWSNEDLPEEMVQLKAVPLPQASDSALVKLGEAAIVSLEDNIAVINVLRQVINTPYVVQIQQEVVGLERSPIF